ncbi:MAG: class I SAM-dependent methyltransferase [Solirubrobacterales bacterium]|nr:class I SAM-dependent methyltransferase [Solirubrobacterales bacterium]
MYPLLENWKPCLVCGSDRLRPLHVYRNKGRLTPEPQLALIGCERCGLAYSVPRPTEEMFAVYYSGGEGWDARASKEESWAEQRHEWYSGLLDLLRPHLELPSDRPPRVLDFGCGAGTWLDVLQDAGWETFGLEPGARLAGIAGRRHEMLDALPSDASFDLAIVHHVLEHLADPLAAARDIAGTIVDGGRLFVSVPDLGRVHLHRKLGYTANELHLVSYTAPGLRSLLGLAGFEIEHVLRAPEFDAFTAGRPLRLRVLARRCGEERLPEQEEPLAEAVESLRALGTIESREARARPAKPAPSPVARTARRRSRAAAALRGLVGGR